MHISYAARRTIATCSLGFFFAMLVPSFLLGLVVGLSAWVALTVPTLTALVLGGLVATIFRHLAGRNWGLPFSALLGGIFGVVNLYLGTFLFSLPLAVASYPEYFDPTDAAHLQEMLFAPLLLAGIPAVPLLIFPATAIGGVVIWKRLQGFEAE